MAEQEAKLPTRPDFSPRAACGRTEPRSSGAAHALPCAPLAGFRHPLGVEKQLVRRTGMFGVGAIRISSLILIDNAVV